MAAQNWIKQENLRVVLELLWRFPVTSRAELARQSGLRPSTITNLVRDLVGDGWVLERGRGNSRPGGGKPTTLLTLNSERGVYLAWVWTAGLLEGALVNCRGALLAEHGQRYGTREVPADLFFSLGRRLRAELPAGLPLLGIGLAVGSVVDTSGAIRASADFPHSVDDAAMFLRDAIARVFPVTEHALPAIAVENDANCIALHAGQRCIGEADHLLALVFTADPPSVGAGVFIGTAVWRGAHGSAGELLPVGTRHTLADLDRSAATAVRFADPKRVVVSLPETIGWEDLPATGAAVSESQISVQIVQHREEALRGAAYLACRYSIEKYIGGEKRR